jgi:hypothetical protein
LSSVSEYPLVFDRKTMSILMTRQGFRSRRDRSAGMGPVPPPPRPRPWPLQLERLRQRPGRASHCPLSPTNSRSSRGLVDDSLVRHSFGSGPLVVHGDVVDSPAGDGMGRRVLGWGLTRAKLLRQGIRRLAVPPRKEVDFWEMYGGVGRIQGARDRAGPDIMLTATQ